LLSADAFAAWVSRVKPALKRATKNIKNY
jgi:hypothetical protein